MSQCNYIIGDTRDVTAAMPDGSVDLLVTSPPFLALRSYLPDGHPDKHREIGSEAGPADFLATLLDLTIEWRRVLAPHGSMCVELGDTFSGSGGENNLYTSGYSGGAVGLETKKPTGAPKRTNAGQWPLAKSMCGIPTLYTWSLAYGRNLLRPEQTFAPWRIRNLIVWARANPPVGALGDKFRPATSYITVACTSPTRWFDLDAVRGEPQEPSAQAPSRKAIAAEVLGHHGKGMPATGTYHANGGAPPLDWHNDNNTGPNGGDILWQLNTAPYAGSHYATYPPELPARLIQAMCPMQVCTTCGVPRRRIVGEAEYVGAKSGKPYERQTWASGIATAGAHSNKPPDEGARRVAKDLGWTDCGHNTWRNGHVLDPFGGSGTTGLAATGAGRDATLIDIDDRNADLARDRIGMFLNVTEHTKGAA